MRAVGYRREDFTEDTGRMPTRAIWDRFPWNALVHNEREGEAFFDDFKNFPNLSADEDDHKYAAYIDTGATIQQVAAQVHGEMAVTLDTDDNDEAWIQTGGNTGAHVRFNNPATTLPEIVAFEARIKKSSITTGSLFVGFAEPGLAAADTLTDGDALADNNFIGFLSPGDPDSIDFVYRANGQTAQTVIDGLDVLVADTYLKVGFVYDYRNLGSQQIVVYLNGQKQSTYVTKANIAAATFPAGDDLAALFGGKNTSGAANTFTMDWWKWASLTVS